ncbi:hypothetical protein BCR34DRAFT_607718 [Clohesyomyces aquaticus]|uniref:CFEM domain-containing protein n=1 Tax=Clohesyomyces aquaticus TaxID=1231657 RepID=A0A1Y1YDT5_9PLEO|nr:hypothetical protein BCR34DRAFT_607718 [Clohesyomyces aquaticus]
MRFSIAAALAVLSVSVAAVDISGAPACMQTCLTKNQGSSTCDPAATDFTCFCADTKFYNVVSSCVLSGCDLTNALASLSWYNKVCKK